MRSFVACLIGLMIVWTSSNVSGGEYAGEFLRNGIGARALAMGSAYVSIADDATAPYWNPAGVSLLHRPQSVAMHASLFDNLATHQFLGVVLPLPGNVAIAFSWNRLSVDDMKLTSELYGTLEERINNPEYRAPAPEGYFSNSDNALYFTFSKTIEFLAPLGWSYTDLPMTFSMGANLKYISQNIYDFSGSGLGLDLGFLMQLDGSRLTSYDPLGTLIQSFTRLLRN